MAFHQRNCACRTISDVRSFRRLVWLLLVCDVRCTLALLESPPGWLCRCGVLEERLGTRGYYKKWPPDCALGLQASVVLFPCARANCMVCTYWLVMKGPQQAHRPDDAMTRPSIDGYTNGELFHNYDLHDPPCVGTKVEQSILALGPGRHKEHHSGPFNSRWSMVDCSSTVFTRSGVCVRSKGRFLIGWWQLTALRASTCPAPSLLGS
jgi:hypothetical protein